MFQWLIVHTVVTAAMAVVVAAAGRWFRLGPAVRHLLWLVVLVKFLTPPIVYWPWTLPVRGPAPPPATAAPVVAHEVRVVIIDEEPIADIGPTAQGTAPLPPAAPASPDPPAERRPAAPSFTWDWPTAAAWAWLAGGAFVALRNGMRILRWRGRLARGLPAPQWLTEQVRDLAGSMGVRPPRVVVLPGAASPMVWGLGAARLIWPLGLEERLPANGRRTVLLHELAHLRRRDHWVGWLLLAGACVWWWHPLFWWVRRRLMQEAELACDAQVVGAAPDGRRAYAEALLEVSQRLSSAAAVPALGAASGRRDLERRLVMIMRGPAARRLSWAGLAAVGVLGLLTLPAWTLGEDPKTPGPPPAVKPIDAPPPAPAAQEAPAAADPAPVPPSVTPAPPGTTYVPVTTYRAVTTYQPVTTYRTVDPNAPAGDADRDKKIKELEEKVEQLLKELQELRGQSPPALSKPLPTSNGPGTASALVDYLTASPPVLATPAAAEPPGEVITLTRVSYKLKPATAEALAAFLKDNVKTAILETKADGETLVVTTTPEAQDAIGQFIGLIQGKTPGRPPGMMGPRGLAPGQGGPMGGLFGPGPGGTGGGVPPPGGTASAPPGGFPPGGPFAPYPGGTGRPAPPPGGTGPGR